jgi:DUF1707 SHOCT-like domain
MQPQDPSVGWAAGGGRLRACDADRERVIDALKDAFAQGQLTKSELTRRAGQALESKTYSDLARATAGIPAGPAATAPPRQHAAPPARRVNWKVIAWVLSAIIVLPGLGVAFFATYYGSLYIMLLLSGIASAATGTPLPPADGRRLS